MDISNIVREKLSEIPVAADVHVSEKVLPFFGKKFVHLDHNDPCWAEDLKNIENVDLELINYASYRDGYEPLCMRISGTIDCVEEAASKLCDYIIPNSFRFIRFHDVLTIDLNDYLV